MEMDAGRDAVYMRMALELADRGRGWTSPNPVVGAVIVGEDGAVIGQGFHARYGGLHAEREALRACRESPAGATMYVTLEPCCHYGKQPPCTEAILEAGIRRVVVGSGDPNPRVAGKGIRILRQHGVEVVEGVLREECDRSNEVFFHYIRTGTPYVVMKYAMTLDGKTAAYTGLSKWVTGEAARAHVQKIRHECSAIMVGIGTVLADDPLLTSRWHPEGSGEGDAGGAKNPVRVICDTHLRMPMDSRIVQTAGEVPTIIATCSDDRKARKALEEKGCRVMQVGKKGDMQVDLRDLMQKLGAEQIDSLLLEGGGTLNWSALEAGIVQRVMAYVAPKMFGGAGAGSPVDGAGIGDPQSAFALRDVSIARLGEDFLIDGYI